MIQQSCEDTCSLAHIKEVTSVEESVNPRISRRVREDNAILKRVAACGLNGHSSRRRAMLQQPAGPPLCCHFRGTTLEGTTPAAIPPQESSVAQATLRELHRSFHTVSDLRFGVKLLRGLRGTGWSPGLAAGDWEIGCRLQRDLTCGPAIRRSRTMSHNGSG